MRVRRDDVTRDARETSPLSGASRRHTSLSIQTPNHIREKDRTYSSGSRPLSRRTVRLEGMQGNELSTDRCSSETPVVSFRNGLGPTGYGIGNLKQLSRVYVPAIQLTKRLARKASDQHSASAFEPGVERGAQCMEEKSRVLQGVSRTPAMPYIERNERIEDKICGFYTGN